MNMDEKISNSINEMGWKFDNSYMSLPKNFYSEVSPSLVRSPSCVILNKELANELGLDLEKINNADLAMILSGNRLPNGAQSIAQAYGGHQFGYFNILGDGRAILIGEHISPCLKRYDIQLKGSGKTPYSTRGDGRAAIGPMLREYIISEAMNFLGIPTTRSLAVVKTGELVHRETPLPGAILIRVAKSHIRVGTFEYAAFLKDKTLLKKLTDYTINRHYKELFEQKNPYLSFLEKVIDEQAFLIAKWMNVGFIHGVMNTDNMSISGETIDYGPCAFMDKYDINAIFSSIDVNSRYAYGKQPQIAQWNLARFAETLLPLLDHNLEKSIDLATSLVNSFGEKFNFYWLSGMRKKLGLFNQEKEDVDLIENLLSWMQKTESDYTNTFRDLTSEVKIHQQTYQSMEFKAWYHIWQNRLKKNRKSMEDTINLMNANNPYIIPRNYLVEEALLRVNDGDLSFIHRLLEALKEPFFENMQYQDLAITPKPSKEIYKTFCGT